MRLLAALFVFFTGLAPAHALDDDEVIRWVATMPPLMAWSEAHQGEVESPLEDHIASLRGGGPVTKKHVESLRSPFALSVDAIRAAGLAAEPSGIVQAQGFSALEDWAAVSDRIFQAYAAQKLRAQGTTRLTFEAAIEQIKSSDTISETRKAEMINRIEIAILMIEMLDRAPDEDIEVVKRHLAAIEPILGGRI